MIGGEAGMLGAFEALVRALNAPRDRALLAAAVIDDVVVARHAPGRGATAVLEELVGIDALAAWFGKTAARSVFALVRAPTAGPDGVTIEYAISLDDFRNGGTWLVRTSADGRIAHLAHRPFPLA
ncbi:MAG: hypothetical protein NT062_05185 [Proteobacteria bacterium]|nr:hypothetical protein [Pseudomonadota bacterium]